MGNKNSLPNLLRASPLSSHDRDDSNQHRRALDKEIETMKKSSETFRGSARINLQNNRIENIYGSLHVKVCTKVWFHFFLDLSLAGASISFKFQPVDSGVHFSCPVPSSPAILGNKSSVFLYLEAFESSTTSDCSTVFSQNIGKKTKNVL